MTLKKTCKYFHRFVNNKSLWCSMVKISLKAPFVFRNMNNYFEMARNVTKLYLFAVTCNSLNFFTYTRNLNVLVLRGYYTRFRKTALIAALSFCPSLEGLDLSGFVGLSEFLPNILTFRATDTIPIKPVLMRIMLYFWKNILCIEVDTEGSLENDIEWSAIVHEHLEILFSHNIINRIPKRSMMYDRYFYSSPAHKKFEDNDQIDLRWK